jgi:uncharacterized protein YndB with AHSA1/START domain
MPSTIRLHRVLTTSPEKVYRAFLEADALAKWLPPNGFTCTVHHPEPKAGGMFRMSFRNFTTGQSHSFGGEYVELVPGERLRYTDKFDDPNLPGEMQVTVTLKKVSVGLELHIEQAGVPDIIPAEACYLGWQESGHVIGSKLCRGAGESVAGLRRLVLSSPAGPDRCRVFRAFPKRSIWGKRTKTA